MDLQELASEVTHLGAYARSELGYRSDAPGHLRRQVQENTQMIRAIEDTLRGHGDDLGLVGWMMVLRRTWITLVAMLGAAFGYLLNDVVHTVGGEGQHHSPFSSEHKQ
jgi:hypothetical protein